jgi:chemotaxis signal transduction protein
MSLRGIHNPAGILLETTSFLVVRLGDTYVALPAAEVRGVLTRAEAGHSLAVTVAECTYHAVDLARRLSVLADLSGLEMRTILYSNGHSHGAIGVAQVVGLIDVERKACFPLPAQFQRDERNWFAGMMLYHDHLVLILNPLWVLEELTDAVPLSLGQTERMTATLPAVVGELC